MEVLQQFASEWTTPCKWWRFARMLNPDPMHSMLRQYDGVSAPATRIENWDLLGTLKLLQSNVFPASVREAAHQVNLGPRRAIAHEYLDCNWDREWRCFERLLTALGCHAEAGELRAHCEKKSYDPTLVSHSRDKLEELRAVWVQYTREGVGRAAEKVVREKCDKIVVPEKAYDPKVVAKLQKLCKEIEQSHPAAPKASAPSSTPPACKQKVGE